MDCCGVWKASALHLKMYIHIPMYADKERGEEKKKGTCGGREPCDSLRP
jgi:hypothetical protein